MICEHTKGVLTHMNIPIGSMNLTIWPLDLIPSKYPVDGIRRGFATMANHAEDDIGYALTGPNCDCAAVLCNLKGWHLEIWPKILVSVHCQSKGVSATYEAIELIQELWSHSSGFRKWQLPYATSILHSSCQMWVQDKDHGTSKYHRISVASSSSLRILGRLGASCKLISRRG